MMPSSALTHRILVIDDEASIHAAYRSILCPRELNTASLDAMDAALFGSPGGSSRAAPTTGFEVTWASQGRDGLEKLRAAAAEGRPYSMAFVDMRMPPGWDGVETIENLWKVDPDLEVVVCSAYSDYSWDDVVKRLGETHRLLVLRKPFDASEVWQLASSLTRKRRAEAEMRATQAALELTNARLQLEVNARQTAEGQLRYDSLTSLPNRLLLNERIERCIERAKRDAEYRYAVVFLDLDDFKSINDSLGHAIGDYLLVEVGKRLQAALRSLDTTLRAGEGLPARLGGDEFVMLLDGVGTGEDVAGVAARIQQKMAETVKIAGHELRVSVSLGYAMGAPHHMVPDDPLRDADAALYQAKADGKGQIHAFDESMQQKVLTRRRLGNDLPAAIEKNQLRVMYQPIVSLETGDIESFESLVRWEHPELGGISPALFIPVAEETGNIHALGTWVLRESCRQLRVWHQLFPHKQGLMVSVNVSTKQLVHPEFTKSVRAVLDEVGLTGRSLIVEITESVFIDNVDEVRRQLESLKALGIALHLDDFGTGFSSLSSFHTLPIDAIKIDRSFVSNMTLDGKVANIVQAVQTMATNRRLKVIAEGIETVEQLTQLQGLACDCGQGYLMSRPLDAVKAQEILKNNAQKMLEPIVKWPLSSAA